MKKVFLIIFVFLMILFNNNIIYASKVSGGVVKKSGDSIPISELNNHRPFGSTKTISEVCFYERMDKESGTTDTKELLIYSDGTASVFWSGIACNQLAHNNHCVDGDSDGSGLKNWGKNSIGVDNNLNENMDASKWYSDNKICPSFMAQSEYYGANWFYISLGSTKGNLDTIKSKANGLPGTTYLWSNTGEEISFTADITCSYAIEEDGEEKVKVYFSKSGNARAEKTSDFSSKGKKVVHVEANSRLSSNTFLRLIEDDKCPKTLSACLLNVDFSWYDFIGLGHPMFYPYYLYRAATHVSERKLMIYGDQSLTSDFCSSDDSTDLNCIGNNCSDKSICQGYTDYYKQVKDDINAYMNASSKEKSTKLDIYNSDKEKLREFCVSVLKTQNYAEGTCIDQCLKLSGEISILETKAGLKNPYAKSKCNIGESIVNMVYNVLKWAKYIAPALVIILSMLDFIKAIASQSDDEMKKAQGKFVKRLIVAALLFLLPFIINFMLKTFGMYNSKCDVNNLFSSSK